MTTYAENWDNYYRRTYRLMNSKSLWEVSPEEAVEVDKQHFLSHFDAELPIIDMGCGTGEQAICLAKYAPKVVGLDVAAEAITIAKERYEDNPKVNFATFDIADSDSAQKIATQYGDCNLYIRGVLHQTLPEDRLKIRTSIRNLLGQSGKLYMIEVASDIRTYLQQQVPAFSSLPKHMRRALISNLPPVGLSLEHLNEWFPVEQFDLLIAGKGFLTTNLMLPDASILKIPAVYAVLSIKH